MRNFNENTIAEAVLDRIKNTPDPRLKQVFTSLVRHLHDFVRDVRVTDAERAAAIDFLTRTGQKCDGDQYLDSDAVFGVKDRSSATSSATAPARRRTGR